MLPFGHFATRGKQRGDLLVVELILAGLCQLSQVAIGRGAGELHQTHCVDERGRERPTRNGEIIDRPLRLGAVVSLRGDLHIPHRVVFRAVTVHFKMAAARDNKIASSMLRSAA